MNSLIASSSSSSSKLPQTNYDVFLSFRGETRNNFTSHLYKALCQKGIHTFLDDDEIERGKTISVELRKAIEGSRCSVVILSEDYASSRWCLDELVKILQCMKELEQIVVPIFYHVDPAHVRKQIGSIGKAFQRHEQDFSHNLQKVNSWRAACEEVGNLAGYHHLQDYGNEAKFIEDFIKEVSSKLEVRRLNVSNLIGMDSRLEELKSCISEDVRFIGICGMGGLGKTTLVRAYFEYFSNQFEASSFLVNVREVCQKEHDGIVKLQKQLLTDILKGEHTIRDVNEGKGMIKTRLRHKKVLVILDDVDQLDQLEGLAEENNWFAHESRIILTTRDESLLKTMYKKEGYIIHKVEKLKNSDALQLFCRNAFKSDYPSRDYRKLSEDVVKYANGLPLALQVLGSFLGRHEGINKWKSALERLKEYPEEKIMKKLQISFDALEETEKSIFLDIACFFNGFHKDYIMKVMDSCGFFPEIGISSLVNKSLLQDNDNKLRMHDLLEEMGKEIVREKSRNEPGKRSRIWLRDDFYHVMNNETGTEEVEAIVCPLVLFSSVKEEEILSLRGFSNMKKLRLFIANDTIHSRFKIDECRNLVHLSNELRFLDWHGCPLNSFPPSFKPHGLVGCKIKQLWNNPMKPWNNLKSINLGSSLNIRKLECFSLFPNLEKLILDFCTNLEEIDPSITVLKRLTLLSLKYCYGLKSLPTSMHGLKSLEVFELSFCYYLGNLPMDLGCLNNLEKLGLSGTFGQSYIPYAFLRPSTSFWKGLSSAGLYSLEKLDLSDCRLRDGEFPDDFGCLVSLKYLDLSDNLFSCLPAHFNRLSKLKDLDLSDCSYLTSLGPELPDSLEMVRVNNCSELHTFLDPLSQCNLRCSAIFCGKCFKLVNRQGSERTAIASLGRYLQNPPSACTRFEIVLPGDKIPSWFTLQVRGPSSISLPLNPNWCTNKWMGFALSVCWTSISVQMSVGLFWEIKINQQDWGFGPVNYLRPRDIRGGHLWLLYLPRDTFFLTEWQNKFGHIQFSINLKECKQCGVRLVYEQDIQELLNLTATHESFSDDEDLPSD